ncbi:site-specific integrase [Mesorhizobium japonicum]|uniref:Integrase/recombinase n=1 Tax=Mesorhizobium japonicum (strain LMG 29417 / CECT 9101 / MAFF 303099) TaxID=266835 RepID=Q981L1_RHILO|nr:site-specific integrase [Mesorhizobium japonicum]BAB54698.1 integrase/recombinase [Mesorhizobium japonicum MAFF 303099]
MNTATPKALFALVESFFISYLPRQRGASPHTTRAYRDTLKLLFQFVAQRRGREIADLVLEDLNADTIAGFLDHLESERSNSAATRNCRRAALRSFFKHLLRNDLDNALRYTRVLALPAKRMKQKPVTYLEAVDVRAIIGNPDRRTHDGWRDHTLLLFLYNSAARVSEATGLLWRDLQLTPPRQVRLRGKGRKERLVPIWRETADALGRLRKLSGGADHEHVFVNRHNQPLTRDGVAYILAKHAASVARGRPRLARDRITPHVLRHSAAVALLQSGTDVTVIRDYLGHSSIATTNRYISTNLKMRRDALETFWKHAGIEATHDKPWKPKPDLLSFLQSL